MKTFLLLLLGVSLAGNYLLLKKRGESASPRATTTNSPATSPSDALPAPPPLTPETWALLQSGDPSSPDTLRDFGLPESVVRFLVRARIEKRYRDRENALYAHSDAKAYWKRTYNFARHRPTDPLAALDLRREKDAELKALLGADYRNDDDYIDPRTTFLAPGKAEDLRLLEDDYIALQQTAYSYDGGIMLPEDREKIAYLEKQKRADLEALLTPEELSAYELRNSSTAAILRWQLASLDLTEDEFKNLHALRKPFDEQFNSRGMLGGPNADFMKMRQQAESALNDQIKASLGDDRYADYSRAQDRDYQALSSLATRLNLPREKAVEAHELQNALEEKLKKFKPSPGSDVRAQQTEFVTRIAREAETGFTALLGEKGYTAYKDHSSFFRRLTPPAPPNPRP